MNKHYQTPKLTLRVANICKGTTITAEPILKWHNYRIQKKQRVNHTHPTLENPTSLRGIIKPDEQKLKTQKVTKNPRRYRGAESWFTGNSPGSRSLFVCIIVEPRPLRWGKKEKTVGLTMKPRAPNLTYLPNTSNGWLIKGWLGVVCQMLGSNPTVAGF